MTPFQRACIVAFWARIDHGESSPQYAQALRGLEYERAAEATAVSKPRGCGRCGRMGHLSTTCANLEAVR